jgi:hypothetical protein
LLFGTPFFLFSSMLWLAGWGFEERKAAGGRLVSVEDPEECLETCSAWACGERKMHLHGRTDVCRGMKRAGCRSMHYAIVELFTVDTAVPTRLAAWS